MKLLYLLMALLLGCSKELSTKEISRDPLTQYGTPVLGSGTISEPQFNTINGTLDSIEIDFYSTLYISNFVGPGNADHLDSLSTISESLLSNNYRFQTYSFSIGNQDTLIYGVESIYRRSTDLSQFIGSDSIKLNYISTTSFSPAPHQYSDMSHVTQKDSDYIAIKYYYTSK